MAEHFLRTLMRTTDVIVAGTFAPAAVAAVGLGDIYSRILTRIGLAIGGGTIALSSQDTGSGAVENRNEAVTQAFLLGFLVGIPFLILGVLVSSWAIAVLGAEQEVVRLGGQYLMIIMVAAPMIHVSFIGTRALQGIGDTRTPMYINGFANALNIVGTVTLAFGLGPFPELTVVGIGLSTAVSESVAAVLFLTAIYGPWNDYRFARPADLTIAKQLVAISTPIFIEGMAEMVVEFPFNAILLVFGTEANAAYHIGRRMYQQVVEPLARGYRVAANVLVGQALGRGDPDVAYINGIATVGLGVVTIGPLSLVLFWGSELFVQVFTADPATIGFATGFAQAYAVAAVFIAGFKIFGGSLRGGSETRGPLYATLVGTFVFMLGVSYVGGIHFGYGVVAAYAAIVTDWMWRAGFVGLQFYGRSWIAVGRTLMEDRGSVSADESDSKG